jgi:hypothetical protein
LTQHTPSSSTQREDSKVIASRITPELLKKFRHIAVDRETTVSALLADVVASYVLEAGVR